MKKLLLIILSIFVLHTIKAGHISGGEMYYRYIGPGSGPNSGLFEVTLRLFRDCNPLPNAGGSLPPPLPSEVTLGVFINGSNATFIDSVYAPQTSYNTITLQSPYVCIINAPVVCYQVALYTTGIELPLNAAGYTIAFQTCCRINGLSNVNSGGVGATYTANIPGSNAFGNLINSSPVFDLKDTVLVCRNKRFTLPFSASDPDADSLSYSFCDAYGSTGFAGANNRKPFPPPYTPLNYNPNFSGSDPLGVNVTINPVTGVISGIAPTGTINPSGSSFFVVSVCISEWRLGIRISEHRKDFVIRISDCDFADAELPVDNRTCDGFTQTFQNLTPSNEIRSWFWDFGVTGISNDTSNAPSPTYAFTDTGIYNVMLIVNRGEVCTDTSFSKVFIYPGFFPGFAAYDGCKNVPIQFTDATRSVYGFPNLWQWDFGNPNVNTDISFIQNPQYSYPQNGNYKVLLKVGSSKGCLDTVSRLVTITDKPPLQLTNDTLICSIDTLRLNAFAQGTFQWTPNYNISNVTIANPLVSPDVRTKYYITVTLAPGCFNTDSVLVDVKDFVTLAAPRDTTICRGDPVTLRPASDGLYYAWSPPNLFTNPTIKNAVATPTAAATLFTVVSSIGKCNQSATVTVRTVPYPVVNAGNDKSVCFKDTVLLAAGGNASSWLWSPARFISSQTNTVTKAYPFSTTNFILRGTDTLGCPKPVFDTVLVRVIPKVNAFAGNDTAVVVGQPLQLKASGGAYYQWTPATYLTNADIQNPVAVFDNVFNRFSYILQATTAEGCFAFDTINIRIFKTAPDIFVPTAFTPDANHLNDKFIPIAVGITKLDYFRVFNRWGNEIYSTTVLDQGWDGTIKGLQQEPGTYVWMVRGTDFTGKTIVKKGTVVLIR